MELYFYEHKKGETPEPDDVHAVELAGFETVDFFHVHKTAYPPVPILSDIDTSAFYCEVDGDVYLLRSIETFGGYFHQYAGEYVGSMIANAVIYK